MKNISQEELSNYKILPFDLYDEKGQLILSAGEVLTVGKLLQLKSYQEMFRKETYMPTGELTEYEEIEDDISEDSINLDEDIDDFDYNHISLDEYKTPINKYSKITPTEQIKLKTYFLKTLKKLQTEDIQNAFPKFVTLRDVILDILVPKLDEIEYYSDLRIVGNYEVCHPINVAVMSGVVAKKLGYSKEQVLEIILASLLHDIGKYQILKTLNRPQDSVFNIPQEELKKHTLIGYNILKNELHLSENICQVALQHHEHNDGTGYPSGLSSDWISEYSKIVNVCNFFDNLSYKKISNVNIKNNKDIIRNMLAIGSKFFSVKILYTFVHMFSYNDTINFDEMYSN